MRNSRSQRGFTLVEMGTVVGIVGLLAFGVLSMWSAIASNTQYKRMESEIGAIVAAMSRHAAERGGRVAYRLYGHGPDWARQPNSSNFCSSTKFNVIGVRLRVPDLTHSFYAKTGSNHPGEFHMRHYPLWVHDLKIPTALQANGHTRVFLNPYSEDEEGYDIETQSSNNCESTSSYSPSMSLTEWKLKVFHVTADTASALGGLAGKMPGFVSTSYDTSTSTATVEFDESINK